MLHFHDKASELVKRGVPLSLIRDGKPVLALTHLRELPADDPRGGPAALRKDLDAFLEKVGTERTATKGRM